MYSKLVFAFSESDVKTYYLTERENIDFEKKYKEFVEKKSLYFEFKNFRFVDIFDLNKKIKEWKKLSKEDIENLKKHNNSGISTRHYDEFELDREKAKNCKDYLLPIFDLKTQKEREVLYNNCIQIHGNYNTLCQFSLLIKDKGKIKPAMVNNENRANWSFFEKNQKKEFKNFIY